jgi:hypothetical protein
MSAYFPEYTDRRRVILEGVIPPASKEVINLGDEIDVEGLPLASGRVVLRVIQLRQDERGDIYFRAEGLW